MPDVGRHGVAEIYKLSLCSQELIVLSTLISILAFRIMSEIQRGSVQFSLSVVSDSATHGLQHARLLGLSTTP